MKGYKAFEPGLICRGKQYAENTVFEENKAEICKSGMHFCETPFDCLDYYPLVDENGNFSEFAEVESLDEAVSEDNKRASKKLRIGARLSFKDFIKAGVEVLIESTKPSGDHAKIGSSGDSAQIGSSGDSAQIGSSGYYAQIGSSGDSAQIGSSGYYAQIGSSGDHAKIGSSGYYAKIHAKGENAVIAAIGIGSRIKASLGSWITLAEYGKWNGKCNPVLCVKSAQIDGETLKPDTWYTIKNGEFVEAEDSERE